MLRPGNWIAGPLMILPAMLALAMFQLLPLVVAVINSLRSFNPFTKRAAGWVGIDNFVALLADNSFYKAALITVVYIVLLNVVMIPLALGMAILIDRKLPGAMWARAAILAALASSEAVTALVWNQMYQPDTGLFNSALAASGLAQIPFLHNGAWAVVSITVLSVWKDLGLPMLIFLGGLQAIEPVLYEAAALDGANRRVIFWRITLPQLRPSLVLALFMTTVYAARLFAPIQILTQGGPEGRTTNLTYYSYVQGFEYSSPGNAAASVTLMLAALIVLTIGQSMALRAPKASGAD
jgi:ABC-type sugar transport system permease subunit